MPPLVAATTAQQSLSTTSLLGHASPTHSTATPDPPLSDGVISVAPAVETFGPIATLEAPVTSDDPETKRGLVHGESYVMPPCGLGHRPGLRLRVLWVEASH
uniref:Uncharacterized protein n=1 Tax=Cannabis sativa TaxID=3483 RepID=A0A803PD74_CANSA